MRYGSVCSGIEAASCAWLPLGWKPQFVAEIDKFPCAVLQRRHPQVPNYGDITRFKDWPDAALDLLVGGTPCQSFSVAGLRKGLDDPRGNLTLTFLGIADRYGPEWFVWENVPGVLSLDEGRAFGSILGGMAKLGYHISYRVLDAQYVRVDGFGRAVPQRRRRVIVVGNLRDWRRSAAVLFEPESLSWDSAPSREAWEGIAPTISARTEGGGGLGTDFDCDGGLIASHDPACSLNARDYKGPLPEADLTTVVAHPLLAKANSSHEATMETYVASFAASDYESGLFEEVDRSRPITTSADRTRAAPIIAFSSKDHGADAGEISPTLRAMEFDKSHANAGGQVAIAFQESQSGFRELDGVHPTLDSNNGSRRHNGIATKWAVRRLTPLECERLQGFPDGYTAITKSDGPRYKALGNSMAVNVMRWIGRRIEMVATIN